MAFLGVDLGTSGVKVIAVDEEGNLLASARVMRDFSVPTSKKNFSEQSPHIWWEAFKEAVLMLGDVRKKIEAIGITSTSGTILPIDAEGSPLHPAIMYNDTRAKEEADVINDAARAFCLRAGYKFSSSYGLPKILWIRNHLPELFDKTAFFIHATDFITGRLTGNFTTTDFSNALKTGFDLSSMRWARFLKSLGIPREKLPHVVKPGTLIGNILPSHAHELGLPKNTKVAAGATDGVTGFIGSGAHKEGDWTTTLGTTLVIKGLSKQPIKDPEGRIYCHLHPDGLWLPGAASSCGCEWMKNFSATDETIFNEAEKYLPTNLLVYPLVRQGERFPFLAPSAQGFIIGAASCEAELFAAYMEGVALIEKWGYDLIKSLGAVQNDIVYSVGGGAKNEVFLKLRATVLGKTLLIPQIEEGSALGAAILAASTLHYDGSVLEASKNMVKIAKTIEPNPDLYKIYADKLRKLKDACKGAGYL